MQNTTEHHKAKLNTTVLLACFLNTEHKTLSQEQKQIGNKQTKHCQINNNQTENTNQHLEDRKLIIQILQPNRETD